jgi:hypothetical protein
VEDEKNKKIVSGGDWVTSMAKRKIYALPRQTKLPKLKKGVVFTTKAGDKVNSIVIEWGTYGQIWNQHEEMVQGA